MTTAPTGYEGEGFPVRRAFAGVDLAHLDPFIMMDQMGEVEYAPGEPKGTPVAPAPRLRDRDLHDRRRLRPPGLPGRRRHDHQRRHPVDDGRRRASSTSRPRRSGWSQSGGLFHGIQLWVNLPARRQAHRARATRTSAPARSPCSTSYDAGALVRVIAGSRRPATPARAPRTRRWRWCTRPSSRARASSCPGRRLQRARLRAQRRGHRRDRGARRPHRADRRPRRGRLLT